MFLFGKIRRYWKTILPIADVKTPGIRTAQVYKGFQKLVSLPPWKNAAETTKAEAGSVLVSTWKNDMEATLPDNNGRKRSVSKDLSQISFRGKYLIMRHIREFFSRDLDKLMIARTMWGGCYGGRGILE